MCSRMGSGIEYNPRNAGLMYEVTIKVNRLPHKTVFGASDLIDLTVEMRRKAINQSINQSFLMR